MPLLKIDHVISFSSEDPVHVANNILSTDSSKKWKCRMAGEKNAIIVLQLEKASVITGIDIGNEHSAYVEILVSRSENNEDYKVLLTMCSFMTPVESRQSQNVNKVRMFSKDELSKPECDEKWDRIKVVCTQPFNKHVQYGLNFIKLHSNDQKAQVPIQTNIGKFSLRPESPDNLSLGSLFSKQKQVKQEEKLTGAAAIREASSSSSLSVRGSPVCKPQLKTPNVTNSNDKNNSSESSKKTKTENESVVQRPKPRNKRELFYSKDELESDDETNNQKTNKNNLDPALEQRKGLNVSVKENKKETKKDVSTKDSKNEDRNKKETPKRKQRDSSQENTKRKKAVHEVPKKPFNRLLENVVLVISGIANPDRGNLRTMALNMGAKYKPDWDNSCTHLICAFLNTPKYNQVKGKGKIVKRNWIEECHSQRRKLPWRRFALDKNEQKQPESEEEVLEEVVTNRAQRMDTDDDDYNEHIEEASDTEERLLEASLVSEPEAGPSKNIDFEDIYSAETDVEEDCSENVPNTFENSLKNLFYNKKFYIDEELEKDVVTKLNRYIVAYKGKVISDLSLNPDVIVTSLEKSSKFKTSHSTVDCVSPNWIWKCHNKQKYVAIDEYLY